jgi:hypothetical protein
LSILHHDNELRDAIRLNVVLCHVRVEGDHVDGMQPPAVGIKVGHDFEGRDFCIESLSVLQVVIPNLVENIAEEFGNATFGHLVAGVDVKVGFVGGLSANMNKGCGIVGDVPVVEGEGGGLTNVEVPWSASYLVASVRMAMREWIPFHWSYGMTMRKGKRVSLIASRSLLVGFPLRGGEVS